MRNAPSPTSRARRHIYDYTPPISYIYIILRGHGMDRNDAMIIGDATIKRDGVVSNIDNNYTHTPGLTDQGDGAASRGELSASGQGTPAHFLSSKQHFVNAAKLIFFKYMVHHLTKMNAWVNTAPDDAWSV